MAKLLQAAPPPPKPAPKPGQVKVVRARYHYSAQQPDELSFEEGDILYILDMITNPNWWKASCDGKVGLIPSNYIEDNTEEIFHPLHEAAKRGNFSFLLDCLANKISVSGLDKAGCTPLHWAAHGGHKDCVQEILRVPSVQINVQNKLGDTPLHSASWRGSDNIVKLLLDIDATPYLVNKEGKTPFDLSKNVECAALLKLYNLKTGH